MAMVLHYIHTPLNALSAGDMVMDGLVLFSRTVPNNYDVLSGGDLPCKSYLLPTKCPCVHESDYCVHNTTEYTLAHVH